MEVAEGGSDMRTNGARTLVICAVLIASYLGTACCKEEEQQLGWKNELLTYLNLNQASFDNWTQGGENTLGWQTGLNGLFANLGPRHEWVNMGKLAYGMQKIGDEESRKSVDEIRLESVYIRKAGYYVDPYVGLKAETQFAKGYEYSDSGRTEISNFLDPGYFTESVGISRGHREILRSRIGLAFKQTITDKFPVPYADDPDTPDKVEETRHEVGLEWVTNLDLPISENLRFTTMLDIFSDMKATNRIDVRWDNLLAAKVAEYVTVALDLRLFYDRDISTKRQLKQSLALGLTYSLL
jgi:hypothetical protein